MADDRSLIPRLFGAHFTGISDPSPFHPQPIPTYREVSLISYFQGRVFGGAPQKVSESQPCGHTFICCI